MKILNGEDVELPMLHSYVAGGHLGREVRWKRRIVQKVKAVLYYPRHESPLCYHSFYRGFWFTVAVRVQNSRGRRNWY